MESEIPMEVSGGQSNDLAPAPVPEYTDFSNPTPAPAPAPVIATATATAPTPTPAHFHIPTPTPTPAPAPSPYYSAYTHAHIPAQTHAPVPAHAGFPAPPPAHSHIPTPTPSPSPYSSHIPTPAPAPYPTHSHIPTPTPTPSSYSTHSHAHIPASAPAPTYIPAPAPTYIPNPAPAPAGHAPYPAQVPAYASQSHNPVGFSTGLFDCFNDPSLFCMTFWCPCITFGRIAEIVDKGSTTCTVGGSIYTLILTFSLLQFIYSFSYRSKMRAQFGMPEDFIGDFCIHAWCEVCALSQEYMEPQRCGYNLALGWQGNIERANQVMIHPPVPNGMIR